MLSALDLKLLRDLGKMKGQMVAVSLVMACGLAMMIMARSLIFSLESTRNAYYERHRFADVFSDLKRAPNALRPRLARIPGAAAVETRVVGKVTLDLPGLAEPADGSILSIPDDRPQQLNQLFLRRGRLPEIGSHNEVVVGEAFAQAHGFEPGNEIAAIIHGARQTLRIVGIALSPEFVFEARPGDTLPDNRRFGVFWMNERELASAFDLDGAFNSVLVDLAPGANPAPVIAELDRLLAPYGGLVAYGRRDHPSATRLDDELRVLRGLSVAFPAVFLSIAAFMTSAVLTRLIRLQREQIAQLKAFGYSSRQVGVHYLKFALVIVTAAILVGSIVGIWLGTNVVGVYHRFFRFPALTFHPDLPAIGVAFLVSSGAAFVGVIGAVRQAVRLPPAEAMRPEPPAEFKASLFERIGLAQLASPAFRMALRNLERKPWQAVFTAFGLALATGIPMVPGAMRDAIDYLISFQWNLAQRQDVTLSLIEPGSSSALSDMRNLPGVMTAEPFRSVPARLRFGHRARRLGVTGLPREALLNRLLDEHGIPVALPPDGLLVSAKLAEILGAKPGDTIILEVQEGRRPTREAVIQGLITDYAGVAAYMDIDSLRRLMREGGTVSGAHLAVDASRWGEFLERVKESPRIGSLGITDAIRGSFQRSTADMIGLVQGLYFSFSIIVSFGVVYNSARIALSERSRDLATLRVVGFTHREVSAVLIGELALLTLVALPVGLVIGGLLAKAIVTTASTETVRLPFVLTARSCATAVLIVLASATFSFAVVSRRVYKLDLLGVLKARD
ncbi:MAG: putative transport system permease protein [Chthoniobacter sp.]|jgi:putative ABC transport system permease protein|nr:putative transport system permease protein [Chthoniobacter sp.]